MQGSDLSGPVPSRILFLKSLTDLQENYCLERTNSYFPQLTKLTNLETLVLRSCNLTGTVFLKSLCRQLINGNQKSEISSRLQGRENPSPMNSPTSNVNNCIAAATSMTSESPHHLSLPKSSREAHSHTSFSCDFLHLEFQNHLLEEEIRDCV